MLLGAQAVRVLAQLGALVVLAHLLPPRAFGLLAMVAAVSMLLDLVRDFGLSAATIQRQDVTHEQVSALFWINAGIGGLLGGVLWACAPLLASFYGEPDLAGVTQWMSLGFVASSLTVQHWALLRRQMRFGAIAGMETAVDLVAIGVAIALAAAGADYWALVVQRVLAPVLVMFASWLLCRWTPAIPTRAMFRVQGLRSLLGFGAGVMSSGLATAFARSIDQVLIGWLWGPVVLGLYERTTRLLMLPVNTINAPIYAAAMPALSRLVDDPARYRRLFCQMLQKVALLTMPAFALCAVVSDWTVEILLGRSWMEAVPLVTLFSISALYLPAIMAVGMLYMTHARGGEMLRASLIDAGLVLIAIVAGLPWGVVGIAGSLALVGLCIRTPVAFWLATRSAPVTVGDICRAIAPPATAAVAILAAVWSLRSQLIPQAAPTIGPLSAIAGTALAMLTLALLAWPETRRELIGLVGRGAPGLLPRHRRSGA